MWVSEHAQNFLLAQVALFVFAISITTSVSLTHGVGGPWLYRGFQAYQPGRGGWRFVAMQCLGWCSLGVALAVALARTGRFMLGHAHVHPLLHIVADRFLPWGGALPLGVLGLFSQLVTTLSLLVFEEDELAKARRYWAEARAKERRAWLSCLTGLPSELKAVVYDFL
jgi:NhaP-type Na+/H+ or K+/H+ antiporter